MMDFKLTKADDEAEEFDGPWALPEGWCWTKIGSVAQLRGEKVDPSCAPDLPFVGLDDIEADGTRIDRTRPFGELKSLGNRFWPGDFLYGRLRPYLNKTAAPDIDGACSGELLVLKPAVSVDRFFLQSFFHARRFVNHAMGEISGDRPRIDFTTIASFDFPLPPIAEQSRIVARIDALFSEIADGEAALKEARRGLDLFRRSLLKAAVTGELTKDWRDKNRLGENGAAALSRIKRERSAKTQERARRRRSEVAAPLDTLSLPAIPDGWAWASIRDLANVIGGLTKNADREKLLARAPYLRVANVQTGFLELSEIKEIGVNASERLRAGLSPNDLLIVEGNGSIDQIGRCALWAGEIENCVHQNHIIKVRFSEAPLPQWCFLWLLSPHGRTEIEQVAASTSGLHTLSISKIEALPIPIPPPAEAAEIIRRVTEALAAADDTLKILDAEAADVARLKQSILKAAFEGRLVPQDPNDEPAFLALDRVTSESAPRVARGRGRKK